jgi:hypothetical protein
MITGSVAVLDKVSLFHQRNQPILIMSNGYGTPHPDVEPLSLVLPIYAGDLWQ